LSLRLIWAENRWYNVICADVHIFLECREIPCNNLDGVEKMGLFDKILGTYSEREVKRLLPLADKIEALDAEYQKLTDDELKAKTAWFKERLANGETLDDILPEAFATVREASWRVLGMKHFRVQLIGGIVLHQGRIAEMKTGEGKTLVATLPCYLKRTRW